MSGVLLVTGVANGLHNGREKGQWLRKASVGNRALLW